MKEVTLRIPDTKLSFFMDLMQQLGFEVLEDINIPKGQQAIVKKRMATSAQNPKRLVDWEKAKETFNFD